MEQGRRSTERKRLALSLAVAFALHGMLLLALAFLRPPTPSPEVPTRSVAVRIVEAPPEPERPARVSSEAPPEPVTVVAPDTSHRARAEAAGTVPPNEARPEVRVSPPPRQPAPVALPETDPAPTADERARAAAVLGTLGRFRVDAPAITPLEEPPDEPRMLGGGPDGPTLAAVLDHDQIELPFEDSELELVFYAPGVRGDLQRLGDAVTKTFGFKTPGGIEVRCAWMVVVVACGW